MLLKDAKLIDDRQSADSECYFWMNDVPYLQYVLEKLRPSVLWSLLSVCLFVCGSVTTITQNCVHRSPPNWIIGKGSDHLQLIDVSMAVPRPREEGLRRAKFLAPPYYSQRAVFASPPSAFSYFKLSCCTLRATWWLAAGQIWPGGSEFVHHCAMRLPRRFRLLLGSTSTVHIQNIFSTRLRPLLSSPPPRSCGCCGTPNTVLPTSVLISKLR